MYYILDQRLCPQCGSTTIARSNLAASSSGTDNVTIIGELPSLEDYIRQIFEESLIAMAPSKQISADYLKNLGRIIVDDARSILHDTTLDIGVYVKSMFDLLNISIQYNKANYCS
jgi:hypothetical protein